jgi:hypothetical protein
MCPAILWIRSDRRGGDCPMARLMFATVRCDQSETSRAKLHAQSSSEREIVPTGPARQTNASANPGIAALDPCCLPARHLDLSAPLDAPGTTVKGTSTAAD